MARQKQQGSEEVRVLKFLEDHGDYKKGDVVPVPLEEAKELELPKNAEVVDEVGYGRSAGFKRVAIPVGGWQGEKDQGELKRDNEVGLGYGIEAKRQQLAERAEFEKQEAENAERAEADRQERAQADQERAAENQRRDQARATQS